MTQRFLSLLAAGAFAAAAATSPAIAEQSDWEPELTDQLIEEKECELDYLTGVIEKEVNGIPVVIGRAHCKDGRSFDVARNDPFEPFELKLCDIAAC